jgi:hypothetical protein
MGWARYAHSMRIFVFNSGLFYLRPTQASLDLLDMVVHRVETEDGWDQALFNECIFFPNSPRNPKVRPFFFFCGDGWAGARPRRPALAAGGARLLRLGPAIFAAGQALRFFAPPRHSSVPTACHAHPPPPAALRPLPPSQDPGVTRRVMDLHKFMNSKTLFKHLRHNAPAFAASRPVMVHVNYHPNKFERMQAVEAHYVDKTPGALDKFPDGSE